MNNRNKPCPCLSGQKFKRCCGKPKPYVPFRAPLPVRDIRSNSAQHEQDNLKYGRRHTNMLGITALIASLSINNRL